MPVERSPRSHFSKPALEMIRAPAKLRAMKIAVRTLIVLAIFLSCSLKAAEARIVKVLPHFLDQAGRHSLHPSLFERDGYQGHLRTHPELCSGMRFDVQWKAHKLQNARLKLEIRGARTPARQVETFTHQIK